MQKSKDIKCLLLGDDYHEQYAVATAYTTDSPVDSDYIANVHDPFAKYIIVDGEKVSLYIHRTWPADDHHRLRRLNYPDTKVFVILFMVDDPSSFESVSSKWVPEIKSFCPGIPFVLAGSRIESRKDDVKLTEVLQKYGRDCITTEEGEQKAKEIGAVGYVECSARTMAGLSKLFEEAARAGTTVNEGEAKSSGKCIIC